ncbi:GH92 family glycosyl hydrolase [Caulobacter sp. S45]|uniref:GH92 family glycosyl hydrolase n=1 Tax=Caulobacter sp. S45 TaxID=1641861 RepID=UPI00131D40FF|nr:GH92 family glycosyl hydrolase [Caulobacter sp. S45]
MLILVAAITASSAPYVSAQDAAIAMSPADLVNPLIGTANGGNVFPGAVAPFGMVQFSPEEAPDPKKARPIAAPGGYEHHLDRIRGFSLTNVSGWGCAGGSGDIPLTPITTPVTSSPSADYRHPYSTTFTHANEQARAGRYRVRLDNGVAVDLTASLRTGSARFAFPAGGAANLLIRASDSEVGSEDARVHVDPAHRTVSGEVTSGNFCGHISPVDRRSYYTLHFVAEFDQPFATHGVWRDGVVTPGGMEASGGTGYGPKGFPEDGKGSGAWVGFDPTGAGAVVNVRIGISYVSEANARANLAAENPRGTRFDAIRDRTVADWNRRLGQIKIQGGSRDQRTVFYTALYHSLLEPAVFSDVNGQYRGMDGLTHRVEGGQRVQYANFSGWDIYRGQFQLLTWLDPKLGGDIAQSLYNQARQNGGTWDRWTHESGAVHVMNGDPAGPALADIWAFGGHGFDARGALASLVQAADHPTAADLSHDGCPVECAGQRPGLDQWLKLHFIPVGAPAWGGAADTLETATAEFGVSSLADRLGDHATAVRFLGRAQYWRNLFNPRAAPDGGYIQNRNADGSWALVKEHGEAPHPFTPSTGDGFVEGTAAQYVWMVPFNVAGLFDAMGGADAARRRLDAYFYTPAGAMAVTESGPLHAELNNEPSIGGPWLYDYAGQPWKTQELVRQVVDTLWINRPEGIPGNDDLGAMSAWYVWAALGVYPETPGRAELVVGSPLFPLAVVHRPGGDVRIAASGAGPGSLYVQALSVDGSAVDRPWLPESFALQGGRLDFRLGPQPERSWGSAPGAEPPSFDIDPNGRAPN